MKFFITLTIAIIGTFGLGIILSIMIFKLSKEGSKMSVKKRVIITFGLGFIFFIIGGILYFSDYSKAEANALSDMKGSDNVKVFDVPEGYFFDGPGTEDALVFYAGAKVDEKAYSHLILGLSEQGIDCFLISMPLHHAFTNKEVAIKLTGEYRYDNWYLCGHSLGGAMVSFCANKEPQLFNGLFLLGSYPSEKIDDSMKFVSFLGSEDNVVDRKQYEKGKEFWPSKGYEVIINGGNHAGYGDYGEQPGDGLATISKEQQQNTVVEDILKEVKGGI
ncbi:MAG: alpha/beta hydrolase [Lachnospiraceae bacterium]|nr:alpha/beta hydrolase [Lachnospiraceae bacterium]